MKNGVECYKDFFPYFKALKTNCGTVAVHLRARALMETFSQKVTVHMLIFLCTKEVSKS